MTEETRAEVAALRAEIEQLRSEHRQLRDEVQAVARMVREALTSIELLVGLMERDRKRDD